jgi:diguanylate cyclase (GGDEF)-like protein
MDNLPRYTQRYLIYVACALVVVQVVQLLVPGLVGAGLPAVLINAAVLFAVVLGTVVLLTKTDATMFDALKNLAQKIENGTQPEVLPTTRLDELGELVKQINKLTNRDKAVQQANSDALTGLANRRGILQKLEAAFKAQKPLALFYIDLDKFKPVNDQYGHEMGDAVLKRVAELFTACVRDGDVVARLGGDEFLILFYGLTDRKLLEERAQKILDIINEPIWIDDLRIKLGASIGITVAPQDGATVEALMNAGDETMYAVKKAGRNGYKFYS